MKVFRLLAVQVLGVALGFAQNYMTVSASHIQDASGNPLANGQLCVQGVALDRTPIAFRAGGGGAVHSEPVCVAVTNGAIPNIQLANSGNTSPVNVAYLFTVTDNTTGAVVLQDGPTQVSCSTSPLLTGPCGGVVGATTWYLDFYEPSNTPLALIQTGPQGPPGVATVVTANGANGNFAVTGALTAEITNQNYTVDGFPSGGCTLGGITYTTDLDCAVATANASITPTQSATLLLGARTYHTARGIIPQAISGGQPSLNIVGYAKHASIVFLDSPLAANQGVIDNNSTATTKTVGMTVENVSVDANHNADIGIALTNLCCNSRVDHINFKSVRNNGFSALKLTNSYQAFTSDLEYDGRGRSGAYGAQITPIVSSGQITSYVIDSGVTSVALTSGGSGYGTTPPFLQFSGGNCFIQPFGAITVVGGVVTGITMTVQGACQTAPTATFTGGSGTGATAGTVTTTLLAGQFYDVYTKPIIKGYGAGLYPCTTMPTSAPVITLAGDGSGRITGVAPASNDVAGMGSGCVTGNGVYLELYDSDAVDYAFYYSNVTDATHKNLVSNVGRIAGIYTSGATNFEDIHIFDSPPIFFYQAGGDATVLSPEMDSVPGTGFFVGSAGKLTVINPVSYWDSKDSYPAPSLVTLGPSAFGFTVIGGSCGTSNTGGDYHHTLSAFAGSAASGGPIDTGQGALPTLNGVPYGQIGYYAEVNEAHCTSNQMFRYANYMAANNYSTVTQGPAGSATASTNFRFNPSRFCSSDWTGSAANDSDCWQFNSNMPGSGTPGFYNFELTGPLTSPATTKEFHLVNPVAATSSSTASPYPILQIGHSWDGSVSQTESFKWSATYGGSTQPNWTYALTHAGSTGIGLVSIPYNFSASQYSTTANCANNASPAVCGSAAAGSFVVAAGATAVTVNTTAVTSHSRISVTFDASLSTDLGVTCNTTYAAPFVRFRTIGTSFTVNIPAAPTTNPACFTYTIVD